MTLSDARNHLDHWLGNNPDARRDQFIAVRVLRDNLDDVLRRDGVGARARALTAVWHAEVAFGCS